MIADLQQRPDLVAVLDVTYPEPPAADSPLYTLPNVILTPHIAGALGNEAFRLGECALAEIERYVSGQPLRWAITREMAARLA
jgi:phosphoglycerate dehydrogenase-like enzyme